MKAKSKKPSKKIRVGLSGASGRMGEAVKEVIKKRNSGFLLSVSAPPKQMAYTNRVQTLKKFFIDWDKTKIDGVLDFSSPELFSLALDWSVKNKKAFVSGTTGLKAGHKKKLKQATKKIPVFYEENMSWGIWRIKHWIKEVSGKEASKVLLKDIHHKNKKDKPSGTALKLKKNFSPAMEKKLKIQSFRIGDEFGTHQITFQNLDETVSLEHKALSRNLFAGGALKALKFLVNKAPGLYSFEDLYKKRRG